MSQKNETTILVLTLMITLGLIGVVIWGLTQTRLIQNIFNSTSSPTQNPSNSQVPTASTTSQTQTFAQVSDVPEGLFSYGGSTTWAPIRGTVDPIIQTVLPQFKLRYTQPLTKPPGSTTGIEMLLDNQLAFSQSSRALKEEEYQQAQQKGFTLQEIPVAIDGIAVAVNPRLNIQGLTVAQLQDIYRGKITNWSQVGGPDLAIIPYSRSAESGGTVEFFIDNILGEELAGNVELVSTTTLAIRKVADNLGGIYYASAPEIVGQCSVKPIAIGLKPDQFVPPYQEPLVPSEACPNERNQLNNKVFQNGEYPITRRLFVIVKQNGQIDQKAGETYANLLLTQQGQDLIEQAGFTRIR
ncbi:MAG: PstS family phosphate ABC transporter substrate-binding protein [Lyngbya sp.]|nr:PstS family phosphate ABC transporter substrate-binding protein [Lyngbya sp.]